MLGNLGGAVGSNIYLAKEAPRYWTGFGVSMTCTAMGIICTFILRFVWSRENKMRDRMSEDDIREKYTEGE